MLTPSASLKEFLGQASEAYYQQIAHAPDVQGYLTNDRALSKDSCRLFRLGVVDDPLPGHETYRGRLSIPYLTRAGVVSIRFRCIPTRKHVGVSCKDAPGCTKYLGLPGDSLQAYNVNALHNPSEFIGIAEGEIDAITATQAGVPTVGLPGVSSLREYTPRMFVGYKVVYIFADNDDKGQGAGFAEKVADLIPNSRVILMPNGDDVNSFVAANGADAFRDLIGV